jgi:prophage regulatory protein
MAERILKRLTVEDRTGLSRSTIYAMMAEGRFPKPIKIGLRAVGWSEAEIDTWLEGRKALRDSAKGEAA